MREEVLVRKLIADGEGTAEEKRFHVLLGHIKALSSSPSADEALKALRQIEMMEFSLRKQNYIAECCASQAKEYEDMTITIGKEILDSKEKMAHAKKELAAARLVRRNRQEYAQLAKRIEELPSRDETARKLEDIQDELNQQHERQRMLEAKLAERRNHLHAFNIILANFQQFLDGEDGVDNNENSDDFEKDSKKEGSAEAEPMET